MTGLRLVYTVAEAAELLGVSRSTAYELVARGDLASVLIGRRRMITRPTLTALLGVEPPLPYELDALRSAAAGPVPMPASEPTPLRTTAASPRRRRRATDASQPALPFRAS